MLPASVTKFNNYLTLVPVLFSLVEQFSRDFSILPCAHFRNQSNDKTTSGLFTLIHEAGKRINPRSQGQL